MTSIHGFSDLTTIHLLLQPFVENAIEHGFRARQGEGTIVIRGALEDECVSMEISDNGCGMTEARIDEIFSGKLKANGGRKGSGYSTFTKGSACGMVLPSA